jgi:hypothetical protein
MKRYIFSVALVLCITSIVSAHASKNKQYSTKQRVLRSKYNQQKYVQVLRFTSALVSGGEDFPQQNVYLRIEEDREDGYHCLLHTSDKKWQKKRDHLSFPKLLGWLVVSKKDLDGRKNNEVLKLQFKTKIDGYEKKNVIYQAVESRNLDM